jgi:hypothetical protein
MKTYELVVALPNAAASRNDKLSLRRPRVRETVTAAAVSSPEAAGSSSGRGAVRTGR